jgi:hypothetical protein
VLELYTLDVSRACLGLKFEFLGRVRLAFPVTFGHNQMLFFRVRFVCLLVLFLCTDRGKRERKAANENKEYSHEFFPSRLLDILVLLFIER